MTKLDCRLERTTIARHSDHNLLHFQPQTPVLITFHILLKERGAVAVLSRNVWLLQNNTVPCKSHHLAPALAPGERLPNTHIYTQRHWSVMQEKHALESWIGANLVIWSLARSLLNWQMRRGRHGFTPAFSCHATVGLLVVLQLNN